MAAVFFSSFVIAFSGAMMPGPLFSVTVSESARRGFAVGPLLIASFGFNFNNFGAVFFLTEGGPPLVGYDVPVGQTDILISFTYNLAASAGRGQNFGLAAAFTFFIFMIVVILSAVSFRYTKRLEEVYGSL